jgi:hypothetical protein
MHKRVAIRGMDGRCMLALKQASSDDPNAGHQRDPYGCNSSARYVV